MRILEMELEELRKGGLRLTIRYITEEIQYYYLTETTKEELLDIRKSRKPIFIYKDNNKLYYCVIPRDMKLWRLTKERTNLCTNCERLFGSDKIKQCEKVASPILGKNRREESIKDSKRIERFPFILKGIQTTNCRDNTDCIEECSLYKFYEDGGRAERAQKRAIEKRESERKIQKERYIKMRQIANFAFADRADKEEAMKELYFKKK